MLLGIERSLAQVIEDAARRADHDLRALLQRLDLARHGRAAVDGHHLRPAELTDLLHLARHLEGQLARGAEDQRLHRLDRRAHQAVDDGQAEGGGLACPGPRLHDQAAPLGGRLEHGDLHRRGVAVAHRVDGAPHVGAERESVERGFGRDGFGGRCGRLVHGGGLFLAQVSG